jgi:AraC-like DNA-binding protein
MFVFSLDSVPPHERFEAWRQHIRSSTELDMRMEPEPGDRIGARMAFQTIGELGIVRSEQSLVSRYRRGRAEIARSPVSYYSVHLHLAGSGFLRLRERELAIAKGDVFVTDTLSEFEMGFPGSSIMVAKVPKKWLAPRVARMDVLHGALARRDEPLARLVMSYFVNGFETAKELTPDASALFVQHSVELLALALAESPRLEPVRAVALRDGLFVRACRLISLRCGEPGLSPTTIAQALGISPRLLQRIFAERDKTLMAHVWSERVNGAAKLLADPRAAHRSITEIAFACGFSDSTHFGRVFAAHMGMTPTQWRRQAR